MSDRYRIEFTEGGVDAFETIITGGFAKVVEKGLDTISGDDNHGWNCTITDKDTGVKVCQWGVSKAEAQEKTFQALIIELENYEAEQMAKKEATEYRSRREYQNTHQATSNDEDDNSWIGKIIGFCLVVAAIIWFVFSVAVPLIIINIASISLIAGLVKMHWNKYLFPISILGTVIIIFDYNNGWSTKTLVNNVSFFADFIPVFLYINISAGLVAAYFIVRNYLNENKPQVENESEFSKRNLIVMGSLLVVGSFTVGLQKYFDTRIQSFETVNSKTDDLILGDEGPKHGEGNTNNSSSLSGRFTEASERLLSSNQLTALSKEDLKIMRNEIFARHGYIFKTPEMKSYFATQSWYHGKYEDVTSMLTSIEKQNVQLIKRHE